MHHTRSWPAPSAVTVVVPVYGAVDDVRRCLRSVLAHVDLRRHRLLVVNDLGPEADEAEGLIVEMLDGVEGAEYVRNPRNFGFVENCNRAAELDRTDNDLLLLNSDAELTAGALDEMVAVLNASERHAAVCPRSNDATLASIPIARRRPTPERPADEAERVFSATRDALPRWTVVPVAVGFCFLVRRSLIGNHGLFDSVFSPGYDEENDFCLRLNNLGYSAVVANRAFVAHASSASFGAVARDDLKAAHEEELNHRYPFYRAAVDHHFRFDRDAVDHFADVLAGPVPRPSLLIDLHHMSLHYDGSTRNALSFLARLAARAPEIPADFAIRTSAEAARFFELESFGFEVRHNGEDDRIYDAAFALSPVTSQTAILAFNRAAPRWLLSHLDVIALRSLRLRSLDWGRSRVVADSLRFADRVASISAATTHDTLAFFASDLDGFEDRNTVIPQGLPNASFVGRADDIEFEDLDEETRGRIDDGGYILVVGNGYPHKQVLPALRTLEQLGHPVLSLGRRDSFGVDVPWVHELPTGGLSDALMRRIIANSGVVVFPSAYEGFGLPIAEITAAGRTLVVFRSAATQETADVLGAEEVRFFETFDELAGTVRQELERSQPAGPAGQRPMRTMDEYNDDLIDALLQLATEEVDLERLRRRWDHFAAIGEYMYGVERERDHLRALVDAMRARRSYVLVERFLTWAAPARRVLGGLRRRLRVR